MYYIMVQCIIIKNGVHLRVETPKVNLYKVMEIISQIYLEFL